MIMYEYPPFFVFEKWFAFLRPLYVEWRLARLAACYGNNFISPFGEVVPVSRGTKNV